jgi:hypothetical protein
MQREIDPLILQFADEHKTAHQMGEDGLFRYSFYSKEYASRHAALFTDGLLYHNNPESFNDPFDCKFHLRWPDPLIDNDDLKGFVSDINFMNELYKEMGVELPSRSIESVLSDENIREALRNAIAGEYERTRVCCFTSENDNPLFWSHYANSHKGYCVRFEVTNNPKSVIHNARKIVYSEDYPTITFPIMTKLVKALIPLFRKSKDWDYEGEYRSIFSPHWVNQLEHNGESLLLTNDNITDVYFGVKMTEEDKQDIVQLIANGPFNPRLWQVNTHPSQYKLDFETYKP